MGLFDSTLWIVDARRIEYREDSNSRSVPVRCGHCGDQTVGEVIALHHTGGGARRSGRRIYGQEATISVWFLCPGCQRGSVSVSGRQFPPPTEGAEVPHLPEDVDVAYEEARTAFGAGCFTSTELMCRKLLIYLAVATKSSEWKKGKTFAAYIDDLESAGHLTTTLRRWADVIRDNANAATHELEHVDEERASQTLRFTELLLRNLFEMGDFALDTDDA